MVTVLDPPAQPDELPPRSRLAFAARPGLIAAAGVFSVIATALLGSGWLLIHRSYWEGQWECSARFDISTIQRHSLTVVAFTAAVVVTVTLFRVARVKAPDTWAVVAYWLASTLLWLSLGSMLLAGGLSVNACARGLSL